MRKIVTYLLIIIVLIISGCGTLEFYMEDTENMNRDEIVPLRVPDTVFINKIDDKNVNYRHDIWGGPFTVYFIPGEHVLYVYFSSTGYHSEGISVIEHNFEVGKKYKLTYTLDFGNSLIEYDIKEQ